ncbi:hypothetical protein BpHYR1_024678 [Brachionus plicatilis]|uniref:Uncharacterized protein n=1 Tax=Brachionus plicatilis TaxID=10195 RepID=A0A3M7SCX0_BRAPC|nr:hypothetical protein BpHYR1_024678 [Brachionus plicatilis]
MKSGSKITKDKGSFISQAVSFLFMGYVRSENTYRYYPLFVSSRIYNMKNKDSNLKKNCVTNHKLLGAEFFVKNSSTRAIAKAELKKQIWLNKNYCFNDEELKN